jgi:hypothetical protein
MTTGMASVDALKAAVGGGKKQEAWQAELRSVTELLHGVFGNGVSRWHPANRKPQELFGRLWFKHAIRGVWLRDGRATATLINPRKWLSFNQDARAFLVRGLYEFYLRDEPNLHDFLIVDLGVVPQTKARATRLYGPEDVEPMSLEHFEAILRSFLQAVERAGFASQPSSDTSIADLFRKR